MCVGIFFRLFHSDIYIWEKISNIELYMYISNFVYCQCDYYESHKIVFKYPIKFVIYVNLTNSKGIICGLFQMVVSLHL